MTQMAYRLTNIAMPLSSPAPGVAGIAVPLVLIFCLPHCGWEFLPLVRVTEQGRDMPRAASGPEQDAGEVAWQSEAEGVQPPRSTIMSAPNRERRISGLTQQQFAEMIGVTPSRRTNTSTASTDGAAASRPVLNASIIYFYEAWGEEQPRPAAPHQRMLLEIAPNFAEIENEKHQEAG